MKTATAYLRISNEEQSTFSLKNQREYVKREAHARGYELPDTHIFTDDGFSATTTKRPGLLNLLNFCKKKSNNISVVIVYRIDRLSRETYDYLGLKKLLAESGVSIISCTEPLGSDPSSEFFETVIAGAAKYENAIKSLRVRQGVLARIKAGLPHGRAPIGYKNVTLPDNTRILIKDLDTFEHIQKAWYEMEKGTHSLDMVARLLNEWGVRVQYGKRTRPLSKQQISRIFADKTYAGYAISKKHGLAIKTDKIPQMISEDTYYAVRSILIHRNKAPEVYQKLRPEFPLRGFVLCAQCNEPLRAGQSKGRSKYYGYYFCQKHATPSIKAERMESALVRLLSELEPDDLLREMFLEDVKMKWKNKYMDLVKQQVTVDDDIAALKQEQQTITRKNANGIIPDNVAKEAIQQLENEIATKKSIKAESRVQQIDIEVTIGFMNGFLDNLGKAYQLEESLELRRFFIGSIFPGKLVYKNGNLEPLGLAPWIKLMQGYSTPDVSISADLDAQIEPIVLQFEQLRKAFQGRYVFL